MSVDHEAGLLWALCSANATQLQVITQKRITSSLFHLHDAAAAYVFAYRDKYGKFPSTQVLRSRHPQITAGGKEPLAYYADQLLERHTYQELRAVITKVTRLMQTDSDDAMRKCIHEMVGAQQLLLNGLSVDSTWAEWNAYENYRDREQKGVLWKTPYRMLNRMVRGVRAQQLWTIVSRSGMCKTWVMALFGICFWEQGADVLFVSKEMGASEIYERMDALFFDMDWDAYLAGKIPLAVMKAHDAGRKRILAARKNKFVVNDSEDMDSNDILSVRDKIREHRPDVVLLDGAYLLDCAGKTTTEKWGNLSRATKRLARAEKVCLWQTLQFNRGVEESPDALANIYGTDAPAQDSDGVLQIKGKRGADTRTLALLKARTQLATGAGEFHISSRFSPKVDLSELGMSVADTKTHVIDRKDG